VRAVPGELDGAPPGALVTKWSMAYWQAASTTRELDVGSLFSDAWRAFNANAGAFVGALVLSLLVVVPAPALAFFVMYQQELGKVDPAVSLAAEWALGAVAAAALQWTHAGLLRMCLVAIRGGEVSAGDIFRSGHLLGPVLVAGIVVQGLTAVGFALCIVPGILWALSSTLALFFVVDHELPAFAAIRASFAATEGRRGLVFVVSLLNFVVLMLGLLLLGVGLFITFPLTFLHMAALYERVWATARPNA
jgi:uncharacterized membrane protein